MINRIIKKGSFNYIVTLAIFLISLSSYSEIRIKENDIYKDSLKNQSNIRLVGDPVHTGYGVKTGVIFESSLKLYFSPNTLFTPKRTEAFSDILYFP